MDAFSLERFHSVKTFEDKGSIPILIHNNVTEKLVNYKIGHRRVPINCKRFYFFLCKSNYLSFSGLNSELVGASVVRFRMRLGYTILTLPSNRLFKFSLLYTWVYELLRHETIYLNYPTFSENSRYELLQCFRTLIVIHSFWFVV